MPAILNRFCCLGIALCAGALISSCSSDVPTFQGYAEGEYVYVASPVGGRLEHLSVQRGQTIEAKTALFKLDADEETAAKQQADEQLRAAEAQLADLKLGRRTPEISVVRAQLAQAEAAKEQATQQFKRDEEQFAAGGIARSQLDDSRANLAIKSAKAQELSGQLQVSRLPARDEQIRAQEAQVAAARAMSTQITWRLGQKDISATKAGLVVDTLFREGEWVPAGKPVVRMLPPKNVKVRFFVPEAVVGGIPLGRKVVLHCDGCKADIPAEVSFISSEPEYTPPIIYSNETRAKLVFLIEARPAEEDAQSLHPGQPLTVTLQ